MTRVLQYLAFFACLPAVLAAGCRGTAQDGKAGAGGKPDIGQSGAAATAPSSQPTGALADAPLEEFRRELLDLAFEVASAIPVESDLVDRSRRQHEAVEACLELGQFTRARNYVPKILNWRKGDAFAELACYCARRGCRQEANEYIARASRIAKSIEDWEGDRIDARVAQAYTWLGRAEDANRVEARLDEPSEVGKASQVRAAMADEGSFDAQVESLDKLVATKQFDPTRNALVSYATLLERFYADANRRALLEAKMKAALPRVAEAVQVETLAGLAEAAARHGDRDKAGKLLKEARAVIDAYKWRPETRVELLSRLASVRHRAGDKEQARREVEDLLALFEARRDNLEGVERAGMVRSIAAGCQSLGDAALALKAYKRAIEEGAGNVNGRPRANDLSATCLSMAMLGVQPDAELWARMRQLCDGLGAGLW